MSEKIHFSLFMEEPSFLEFQTKPRKSIKSFTKNYGKINLSLFYFMDFDKSKNGLNHKLKELITF